MFRGGGMPSNDPYLKTPAWQKIRAYWLASTEPCARCGGPIDRRRRARGPWALDVGHIVSRYEARRLGWPESEIHSIRNTQPEHRRCNRAAGAMITNQIKIGTKVQVRGSNRVSRAW